MVPPAFAVRTRCVCGWERWRWSAARGLGPTIKTREAFGGARTSDTECPAIAGPGMGETKLTLEFPILRGRRRIAVAFLTDVAVTAAVTAADARHSHPPHEAAHSES